jgi:hypothetical protein
VSRCIVRVRHVSFRLLQQREKGVMFIDCLVL